MKTKTFSIPEKIQQDILERGFYLYEWITPKDVKNIIKKIFLQILNKFSNYLIIFFLILCILLIATQSFLIIKIFFGFIVFISIIILSYLLFEGIKKSYFMTKNSYIVLTNSFVLLNGKAINIKDFDIILKELDIVENIFLRNFFQESAQINLFKELIEYFLSGYNYIYNKKIGSIVIILLFLYTIYILVMGCIYIFGIFLVWILSIFIVVVNKFILKKVGHKITNINNLFLNIDKTSNILEKSRLEVGNYLKQAQDNNREDALSLKINNCIEEINNLAKKTINSSSNLKKEIINSKYNNIYDFKVYDIWIKKQIYKPLFEIKILLEINLKKLYETQKELEEQIKNQDEMYSKPIKIQKMRLDLQINNIYDKIMLIEGYLLKLS